MTLYERYEALMREEWQKATDGLQNERALARLVTEAMVETIASGKIGFNRRVEVGVGGGCYATFTSDLADEHARLFIERVLTPSAPGSSARESAPEGKQ